MIQFTKERLYVIGPVLSGTSTEATILVKRTGDPTARLKVRVYTLDGSARAERDYLPTTEVRVNVFYPLKSTSRRKGKTLGWSLPANGCIGKNVLDDTTDEVRNYPRYYARNLCYWVMKPEKFSSLKFEPVIPQRCSGSNQLSNYFMAARIILYFVWFHVNLLGISSPISFLDIFARV